jgi:hypothetical protein
MLTGAGLDADVTHLDQGFTAGTSVTPFTGGAVTFLPNENSAITPLMGASEHRTFAVLCHSSLLVAVRRMRRWTYITPVGVAGLLSGRSSRVTGALLR